MADVGGGCTAIFESLRHNPELAWITWIPVGLIPVLGTLGISEEGRSIERDEKKKQSRKEGFSKKLLRDFIQVVLLELLKTETETKCRTRV